jgi:flavin-dependent dehydrogenase
MTVQAAARLIGNHMSQKRRRFRHLDAITTMVKLGLIVGAGPVGLTMACELARYGVAVRIVDKAAQRTDKSKALVLWSRTLELLDRGGGSTPFIDAGFKAEAVNFIAGDKVIGRVSMESVQSP